MKVGSGVWPADSASAWPYRVRSSPRYIARDGNALPDSFGRAGAALKLRWSSTELKAGEMRTRNPIFNSSDTRLLPESNGG